MKFVIIGNSTAAAAAVEGIRIIDKKSEITMISDEKYHTYSRPLISYYLAGKVDENGMYYRSKDFYKVNNVETIFGIKAVQICAESKKVILSSGEEIKYDKLLIAVGGRSFVPQIDGIGKENIFNFLKWDEVKKIKETAKSAKKSVVIGAGLIGLKAAEALRNLGLEVTVVELSSRILSSILDEESAEIVKKYLEEQGIKFKLNTTVESALGDEKVNSVLLKTGKKIECDLLITAVGVIPNTELVKDSDMKVNRGIIVNEYMETSIKNIYAAGDVAEGYDFLNKENRVAAVLPNAYKQGETAGINMAGVKKIFPSSFAFNSINLFGFKINTAGITAKRNSSTEFLVKKIDNIYKKLVIEDDKLRGYIILNDIERSGILTGLIEEEINIAEFKDKLLDSTGLINMPRELRYYRQYGGGEM